MQQKDIVTTQPKRSLQKEVLKKKKKRNISTKWAEVVKWQREKCNNEVTYWCPIVFPENVQVDIIKKLLFKFKNNLKWQERNNYYY